MNLVRNYDVKIDYTARQKSSSVLHPPKACTASHKSMNWGTLGKEQSLRKIACKRQER